MCSIDYVCSIFNKLCVFTCYAFAICTLVLLFVLLKISLATNKHSSLLNPTKKKFYQTNPVLKLSEMQPALTEIS